MEKVILRLISDLNTLLNCPNPWVDRLADYEPLPTETIKTLDNELPNLLAYCKRVSISPEVKVLMNLLAEVINKYGAKYGATNSVSPYRYSGYTFNAFADTPREIEETRRYSLEKDLANSCKPWLYWLYQYFPPQASEGVDELPTFELQELPTEIDTEQARKYFARAIEAKYMTPTANGYKWEFGGKRGGLARLGYFVERVFCPTNTEQLPEQVINKLFGVTRIGSATTQLHNAKKPQKWRAEIDKLFID